PTDGGLSSPSLHPCKSCLLPFVNQHSFNPTNIQRYAAARASKLLPRLNLVPMVDYPVGEKGEFKGTLRTVEDVCSDEVVDLDSAPLLGGFVEPAQLSLRVCQNALHCGHNALLWNSPRVDRRNERRNGAQIY